VALLDSALVRVLPAVPRPVVKRLADRYIAGSELADACRVVERLNGQGKMATIDVLGEEVTRREDAEALVDEYMDVFETIRKQGLDSNVSVKPTGLGLKLDRGLARENVARIVRCASERENFVRIDMEDASTTTDTLAVYGELRAEGLDRVGVVLQARLRRTLDDVAALADLRPSVRMCKGIYLEPEEIAYTGFQEIRDNYVLACEALLEAGCYVAFATHDEWLVERVKELVRERGLDRDEYEFQMLLGVREPLGDRLVAEGHRLRIYVPYGRRWYEYSMRRLQENPRVATYIAFDTLSRVLPGGGNGRTVPGS
jgi:proline dehydrogenase